MKNNLGIIVFLYFLTFLNLLLDIYSLIFYLTLKKKFDFFYNIDNQVWGGARKSGQFSTLSASAKLSSITSVGKMWGVAVKSSNQECLWTKTSD